MIKARYTVVLKTLLDLPEVKKAIDNALNVYPLYDKQSKEEYIPSVVPTRERLNEKLLNHYKYREIAFESAGRFVDELQIAMVEIMPYYNQLLFSADQDYNIQFNVDYKKTIDRQRNDNTEDSATSNATTTAEESGSNTSESNSTAESTTDGYAKSVKSDTPQGQLDIDAKNINSVDYASEAGWSNETADSTATNESETNDAFAKTGTTTGNSETNATGKRTENENIIETTKGNFGVMATQDLIKKYRDLILNIEQMIITDKRIEQLFMHVF